MDNVRPIRPGVTLAPAGQTAATTDALVSAMQDYRRTADTWRLAFFVAAGVATYQWYQHSYKTGRSRIRKLIEG